jgi:hypothetical protein
MVTVTADGTFYIGFDDMHLAYPPPALVDAGIAVTKSTDGGLTWSQPVLAGTPTDRPWMTTDLSTGTIYEASGSPPTQGRLGPASTGNPNAPVSTINDRWLVSSQDGVHWTAPERLGGGGVPGFTGASSNTISAAHGMLAATFRSTSACASVSTSAPCTVFQTTTDAGATWVRHAVPVPSDSTGSVMVAADPTQAGRFTVAVLNSTAGQFLVYTTTDSGTTWTGPTVVSEDATKVHFKAWMAYSPQGVLGITWRTNQPDPDAGLVNRAAVTEDADSTSCPVDDDPNNFDPCDPPFPYNVWAAISNNNGASFSQPLEISTGNSPAPDPKQVATDDTSNINLDGQDAFVAWGDWRPGEMTGYFSTIKLQAFNHS